MRRFVLVTSLVLALALPSAAAFAQPGKRSHGRHGLQGRLAERLDLTEEQKERLKAIREANRAAFAEARGAVRARREALDQALLAEPVDRALVDQRIRELTDAQAALLRVTTSARLEMREVLTPEQRGTMRSLREDRRERMGKHRAAIRERREKRRAGAQ